MKYWGGKTEKNKAQKEVLSPTQLEWMSSIVDRFDYVIEIPPTKLVSGQQKRPESFPTKKTKQKKTVLLTSELSS